MAGIDVAVFTFDDAGRLRLVNRAGAELLGQPEAELVGRSAATSGWRRAWKANAPHAHGGFPGPHRRALEPAPHEFRERGPAAPTPRAGGREPILARGGTRRVAAAHPRAGPRDQQFPRAHRFHRRQPAHARRPARRTARRRLARRHPRRAGRHRRRGRWRWAGSWARIRGWRGCPRRTGSRRASARWCGARRRWKRGWPWRSHRRRDGRRHRRRPGRAGAHQPDAQRRRRRAGNRRRRARGLVVDGAAAVVTVEDEGSGWAARPTCSCRFSRRKRTAAASGWCSAARSPRRTAAR